MPQHVHREHGKSDKGWSEAAHEATKSLFTRLEGEHGQGKVTFVSVRALEFWADVKPNPGSIHTFGTVVEVTAEHP